MLERRAAIELVESAPGFDERFLRQVFDLVGVAFIPVQNGEDAGLMAADNPGEIVRRAVANACQQFGIVVHGLVAQPFADACDDAVHKVVRALLEIGDLLALFIGQDGRDFAVNFHAFNR